MKNILLIIFFFFSLTSFSQDYCSTNTSFDSRAQWGIVAIKADSAWTHSKGANVTVAVIDNGANLMHEDIEVSQCWNTITNSSDCGASLNANHGTCVAGIITSPKNGKGIVGVAPEANLMVIKAEHGNADQQAKAINWAVDNGAKVINCSWRIQEGNSAVRQAVNKAYNKGVVIVGAAGNGQIANLGDGKYTERIITVGAVNQCMKIKTKTNSCTCDNDEEWFSTVGDEVDIYAPGLSNNAPSDASDKSYFQFRGTSAAAPHVAGVAALMLSVNPQLTPCEVKSIIESTAQQYSQGSPPIVDALEAVKKAKKGLTPVIGGEMSNGQLIAFSPQYNNVCNNQTLKTDMFYVNTESVVWQKTSSEYVSWSQVGNNLSFRFTQEGQTATFKVTASNGCKSTVRYFSFKSYTCSTPCNQYRVINQSNDIISIAMPPDDPCESMYYKNKSLGNNQVQFDEQDIAKGNDFSQRFLPEKSKSFQSENMENNTKSIVLMDLMGNTICSQEFHNLSSTMDFDVSNIKSGVYIISITSGSYIEQHRILITD